MTDVSSGSDLTIWSADGPTSAIGGDWLLGLTRQGQTLNRETPGTIDAAVQRVLKTTTRDNLDGTRAVPGKVGPRA